MSGSTAHEPVDENFSSTPPGVLRAYLEIRGALCKYLARFALNASDVEDIAQETFLRAYRAEKKREIEQPKAFLFRIAKNLALSELSRRSCILGIDIAGHEYDQILRSESIESEVIRQQWLGIYGEAIASLPPQCRRVVLMKKVYGMSNREIAECIGIAVSTVEKHLVKGLRQCDSIVLQRYGTDGGRPGRLP